MDKSLARAIRVGLAVVLIAVPLIYSSHTQDSFSLPKRVFFQLAVGLLLLLFAIRHLVSPARLSSRRTPADALLLLWLAWYVLSALCSANRAESMREMIFTGCIVGFFFLITRNVENNRQVWFLIGVIVAMGVLESAYGIAERFGVKLLYEAKIIESATPVVDGGVVIYKTVSSSRGNILGTFGNANHLASYLVLTAPLILGGIALFSRGARPFFLMACLVVTLACLVLTGARAAWIATAVALSVFGAYWLWRDMRSGLRFTGYAAILLAVLLVVVFLTEPKIANEFVSRIKGTFTDATGSQNIRLIAWRLTPRMIAASPILGSGPGTYKLLFLPALADYLKGRDPLSIWFINEKMNEPHNEYLQVAVENGLPGLAIFLVLIVIVLRAGWKHLYSSDQRRSLTGAALMAAVAGILTDAAFSIPFHVVPTFIAFWAAIALIVSMAPHPAGDKRPRARRGWVIMPSLGIILFAVAAGISSVNDIYFSLYFKKATSLNHMERYDEALRYFQRAHQINPASGRLKFYYGSTLVQLGRYAEGAAVLEESKKNFQDIYIYKNLGIAYEGLGQPERAAKEYSRWREMGIASHEANNLIALLRMRQGRIEEAEALLKETLRVRPWDWTAYATLGTILMDTGKFDEAVATLKPEIFWKNPDAYTLYGVALLKAGRYVEAEKNLRHALSLHPDSVRAHNNLGALYYMTGRRKQAVREWEKVLTLDPRNAIATKNLESVRKSAQKKATDFTD